MEFATEVPHPHVSPVPPRGELLHGGVIFIQLLADLSALIRRFISIFPIMLTFFINNYHKIQHFLVKLQIEQSNNQLYCQIYKLYCQLTIIFIPSLVLLPRTLSMWSWPLPLPLLIQKGVKKTKTKKRPGPLLVAAGLRHPRRGVVRRGGAGRLWVAHCGAP